MSKMKNYYEELVYPSICSRQLDSQSVMAIDLNGDEWAKTLRNMTHLYPSLFHIGQDIIIQETKEAKDYFGDNYTGTDAKIKGFLGDQTAEIELYDGKIVMSPTEFLMTPDDYYYSTGLVPPQVPKLTKKLEVEEKTEILTKQCSCDWFRVYNFGCSCGGK